MTTYKDQKVKAKNMKRDGDQTKQRYKTHGRHESTQNNMNESYIYKKKNNFWRTTKQNKKLKTTTVTPTITSTIIELE